MFLQNRIEFFYISNLWGHAGEVTQKNSQGQLSEEFNDLVENEEMNIIPQILLFFLFEKFS